MNAQELAMAAYKASQSEEMEQLKKDQAEQFLRSYHFGVIKDVYVEAVKQQLARGAFGDSLETADSTADGCAAVAKRLGDRLMQHLGFMSTPKSEDPGCRGEDGIQDSGHS